MTVTIADATLRQNLYEVIFDLLATDVATSTSPIYQYKLTAAYIQGSKPVFPQIVLNPVDVDRSEPTFGSGNYRKDIRVLIDIFTKKSKEKDIAADRIQALLDANAWDGVVLIGVTESNALETPGENEIHLKSVALSFLRR